MASTQKQVTSRSRSESEAPDTARPPLTSRPSDFNDINAWSVGAAVLRLGPTPQLLLVRRAAHEQSFANCWEIPGGGVDDTDQSFHAALARELREETGLELLSITAQIPGFIWGQNGCNRQLSYVVRVENDESVALDPNEHSAFMWARFEDVESLQISTTDMWGVIGRAFKFAWSMDEVDEASSKDVVHGA